MSLVILPNADRSRWYADRYKGSVWSNGPDKNLLHTTETTGLPGYGGGAAAPNTTIEPFLFKVFQHFPLNMSSRALMNLRGGVETNHDRVVQHEIISYSDRRIAEQIGRGHMWVGAWGNDQYEFVASVMAPIVKAWNIPYRISPKYTRNPRYGRNAPQRMSNQQWLDFSGWTYHAAVPENSHWDTGALDIPRLMELTRKMNESTQPAPTPQPTPQPKPQPKPKPKPRMPRAMPFPYSHIERALGKGALFAYNRRGMWSNITQGGRRAEPFIKAIQRSMNSRGYTLAVDGKYGPRTEAAVHHFQKNVWGVKPGPLGPRTWEKIHSLPIKS